PLRHRRGRPAGQPVGRGDRCRTPAGFLRGTADDPARPALRRAPRGAVRHHGDVRRDRHGRHGHLGERGGREMREVGTKALLRLVNVPGLDRPAALITLDNGHDHTKPNTFGPAGLSSLDGAIDEALAARPSFLAVTGKPYVFCVGADLTALPTAASR